MADSHSRTLWGRQPARALLIDASSPFDDVLCDIICEALENLFSLACNIAGPSQIPYISIFLLTDVVECILPLSYVKSNLVRIQNALSHLKKSVGDMSRPPRRDDVSFSLGVHAASEQYRRQQNTISQVGTNFSQLEIFVLTCQRSRFVQQQLESVLMSMEVQHLKRIVGVTITSVSVDEALDGLEPSPVSLESTHTACSPLDLLSLQNFFHSWLMDSGGDSEYLHIILPPATPDEDNVVIKCDMQERLVNPAQLPCSEAFTLHPRSASCKTVFPSNSKAVGMVVPLHRIKISAMIPFSSLCESVIFGMPMVVTPTKCWKVDWDELEKNEQLFKALCHQLIKKGFVMLGQLEDLDVPKPTPRRQRALTITPPSPQGYFVLLPAPNMSLLIKSVAVKELMLPCSTCSSVDMDEPSEENVHILQAIMNKIEVLDSFNPLLHSSGLFESLRFQSQKTSNLSTRPTKRKVEETPAAKGYDNNWSKVLHSNYSQTMTPGNKLVITARQPANNFLTELE
ncbi:meiosis 1 arrest protein-like isoform X2 [Gigantopelta aegis]|uniref:meiosis 1 arrest protein-like isoform X2 n=1 Tax=Gigantopelta aegis TaxID=1735272 RepID=UPI001B888FB0|nr:meiosis 1 arrest protein-like isoform X2 [Gigantopelta aegis]